MSTPLQTREISICLLHSRPAVGGSSLRETVAPLTQGSTMKSKLPEEPKVEDILAIVDTREQRPLDLSPLQVVRGTLATGDYSVVGLESVVAVERKSLDDLLGCIGTDRARFDREVQRLLA